MTMISEQCCPRWLPPLLTMVFVTGVSVTGLNAQVKTIEETEAEALAEWRGSFPGLTTAELENWLFDPPKELPPFGVDPDAGRPNGLAQFRQKQVLRDYVLSEILKRDKEWSQSLLAKAFQKTRTFTGFVSRDEFGGSSDVLIAWRRALGQADPLRIDITTKPIRLAREKLSLPIIVKNVDGEQAVYLQKCDADQIDPRFRIVLKDGQGNQSKKNSYFSAALARTDVKLNPGEGWETKLQVRDYIEVPPPGKYEVQVQFNNRCAISSFQSVDGLVLCQSDPLELIIDKTKVETTIAVGAEVRRLVADLDGTQPLKIVAGTYGKWAHATIGPDSPEGKLLLLGAAAVPPLVEIVQDEKLNADKRAWLFGLLYTLTGDNDPRRELFTLGSYTYVQGPWHDWTRPAAEQPATANRASVSGRMINRGLEGPRLQKFAEKWKDWLATNCDVQVK